MYSNYLTEGDWSRMSRYKNRTIALPCNYHRVHASRGAQVQQFVRRNSMLNVSINYKVFARRDALAPQSQPLKWPILFIDQFKYSWKSCKWSILINQRVIIYNPFIILNIYFVEKFLSLCCSHNYIILNDLALNSAEKKVKKNNHLQGDLLLVQIRSWGFGWRSGRDHGSCEETMGLKT